MDIIRINHILMNMGGSTCSQSYLINKKICSLAEINELIQNGFLIQNNINGSIRLTKTEKAKKIW